MTDPIAAIPLTASVSRVAPSVVPSIGLAPAATTAPTAFANVLADMVSNAVSDLRSAETTSTAALSGTASTQQVVEAVGAAQDSLNITLAVRNRAIAAYQEIAQMGL